MDTDSSANERMPLFVAVSIEDIDAVLSEMPPRGGQPRSNSAPPAVFEYPPSFRNTPFTMETSAPRAGHSGANIGELAGEPSSAITIHGAAASTVSAIHVEEDQHPDADALRERKVRAVHSARADVRMSLNGVLTVYENADQADCIPIIALVSDSQMPVRQLLEFETATATVQLLLKPCRNSGTESDADRGVLCLEGLLNERNIIDVGAIVLALETQRSKALLAMDTFQQWPKDVTAFHTHSVLSRPRLRRVCMAMFCIAHVASALGSATESIPRAATTTLDVVGALFLMLREFGIQQLSEPTSRLNLQKAFETAVTTLSQNALSYIQAQEERRRCLSLALDARVDRKNLSDAERMDIALALKEPCHVSSPLPIDLEDDCMRVLGVLESARRNRDSEEGLARRASSGHLEERTRRGWRGRISSDPEESHANLNADSRRIQFRHQGPPTGVTVTDRSGSACELQLVAEQLCSDNIGPLAEEPARTVAPSIPQLPSPENYSISIIGEGIRGTIGDTQLTSSHRLLDMQIEPSKAHSTLLCPHIPLAKEICDCVGTFDMACLRMLRRVEEVNPRHPLCPLIQTRILVLRDYAVVISDIMTGLFNMTSNIRELIISDQRPEALLSDTHHDHQALLRLLGRALDDGCRARDALLLLEQQVISALSYPRLLQSLLVFFLGSFWSRREMARTQVPPVIRALCDDLQSIVSFTARLKDCVADMPQRFSVPQLAVIRSAEAKTRDEVAKIVKQAAWELYSSARSARETANFLQQLATE